MSAQSEVQIAADTSATTTDASESIVPAGRQIVLILVGLIGSGKVRVSS